MRLNSLNETPRKQYIYLDASDLQGDIDVIIGELERIKRDAKEQKVGKLKIELDLVETYGYTRLEVYLYGEPIDG